MTPAAFIVVFLRMAVHAHVLEITLLCFWIGVWVSFIVVWITIDVLDGHASTVALAGATVAALIIQRRRELALDASPG